MKNPSAQSGFTTLELMIVVAITAILAAITAPSFVTLINDTKLSSITSQLVSDLNRARSEAIKRNTRVLLCVRNAAGTDCGTGTNWQNGWLICYGSGSCDTNAPADGSASNPLLMHAALDAKLTLTGSANLIQFNPNGTQGSGGTATLALRGTWANTRTNTVSIATTGYISKP